MSAPAAQSDSLLNALAGALGGGLSMATVYPLVTLSTRAAVETKRHPPGSHTSEEESKPPALALWKVLAREGTSLYDGLGSAVFGIAVTNAVFYGFFEETRHIILRRRGGTLRGLTTGESMLASLLAGTATTVASTPIWVVNVRQSVSAVLPCSTSDEKEKGGADGRPRKMGALQTLGHIIKEDGPLALWRGLLPSLLLVGNPVISYSVFEQLKNLLTRLRTERARGALIPGARLLTDVDFFLLGALSKLVATLITYPILVVKSRLQSGQRGALKDLPRLVREEGVGALYRGLNEKLLSSVLTNAFLFSSQARILIVLKGLRDVAASRRVRLARKA